jgi:hypothetical protein
MILWYSYLEQHSVIEELRDLEDGILRLDCRVDERRVDWLEVVVKVVVEL